MNSCLRSTFTFSKGCDVFLHHLRNSTGPKGTPLEYFRLWDFFWKKITKGPPLSVFSAWWDFFQFLFHKRFPNSPIFWHFEVLLLFLSFRYGTDLGRSRVVCHDHITKLDSGWAHILPLQYSNVPTEKKHETADFWKTFLSLLNFN